MFEFIFGAFLGLHGLVHLLYVGQSQRRFELQPGLAWPDGSWAFSRLFGDKVAQRLASLFLILAAAGFAAGGLGVLIGQAGWRPVVIAAAAFSTLIFLLFWNGRARKLPEQGLVAILINLAVLAAVLLFRWPG